MKSSFRFLVCVLLAVTFSLSACDNPEEKAAKHIERGNTLFQQEDYTKARLEYKNAVQLMPTDAEARYRLGLVDEAQGDFRNAFANYTQAEQQNAQHQGALLKLAQYYMAGDQLDQSRKYLNTVFAASPDNAEGHALLGGVLLREKKLDEAEKEALFALQKEPANTTATSVLTGLYKAKGDEDKATQAIENGIKNNPKDVSLLLLKASLFEQYGNLPKITEAYEAVFKLKPNEPAYRMALASSYIKNKKIDEAELIIRQTITDFPERMDIKRKFVDFLNRERGLEIAEKEITLYMTQNPEQNDPYFWLADLYISNKDIDRAAALLEKIIVKNEQNPASLNASASLARIHFTKGDKTLAKKLVDAILEKNPGHSEALYVRASLAFDDGAYQNAITDLRAVIRDNPKTTSAYQLLSEILLLQGRLDLASDMLGKLLETHPDNAPARVRIAQLFEATGNAKYGLEHLALVTKALPAYAVGWESTARLAITAHKWDLAESAIDALRPLEGQTLTADFLTGQMMSAQGKTEEALTQYKKIVQTAPQSPLAEHATGAIIALYEKDKNPQAIIDFLEPLTEKGAFALNALGESYMKAGKLDLAASAFEKVIETGTRSPKPYLNRAVLFAKAKDFDNALDVLQKGSKNNPADVMLPLMIADIYSKQNRHDDAIAVYEGILARNPDVPVAANNIAQLIADHKNTDSAMLEKARLIAERFISSPNPLLMDTLAWVYFRQGKLEQARTILDRAMATKEARLPAQMYYHHGALLAKMGDKPRAKEALEKAVSMNETYDGLEETKALLAGMR
ncbi:MAG TPA: hypothetical protein DCY07_02905 [Rhodospirillaceae bacterium]|nr:hypothetical protein [Rhodospirillaceae bacterium]